MESIKDTKSDTDEDLARARFVKLAKAKMDHVYKLMVENNLKFDLPAGDLAKPKRKAFQRTLDKCQEILRRCNAAARLIKGGKPKEVFDVVRLFSDEAADLRRENKHLKKKLRLATGSDQVSQGSDESVA